MAISSLFSPCFNLLFSCFLSRSLLLQHLVFVGFHRTELLPFHGDGDLFMVGNAMMQAGKQAGRQQTDSGGSEYIAADDSNRALIILPSRK